LPELWGAVLRLEPYADRLSRLPNGLSGDATPIAHRGGQRLQRRYRTHRDKLFVFLERSDVPADTSDFEGATASSGGGSDDDIPF